MIRSFAGAAIAALLIGVTVSPVACGWSKAGHAVIAEIVWRELSTDERAIVSDILSQHPDRSSGFDRYRPGAAGESWDFRQAAIWPDIARSYWESDPDRYERFSRDRWHYINQPVWLTHGAAFIDPADLPVNLEREPPADSSDIKQLNASQAVHHNRTILATSDDSAARAEALSWLLHIVADLHQPLHTVALFGHDADPTRGDRGGNDICLQDLPDISNLHAFMDAQILADLSDPAVLAKADAIGSGIEHHQLTPFSDAFPFRMESVLAEGLDLASSNIYTAEVRQAIARQYNGKPCLDEGAGRIDLPLSIRTDWATLAPQRALLAANRLAWILKQDLARP